MQKAAHLSTCGYCSEALTLFHHKASRRHMCEPHKHTVPVCWANIPYAKPKKNSPKLLPEDKLSIQQVIGTFLYYAKGSRCHVNDNDI